MPTKVIILPEFEKDLKHLKRKYPAVTKEVRKLIVQLAGLQEKNIKTVHFSERDFLSPNALASGVE
jgi:mRNA-degrading endonuclease RelE of RelBE toxin-antitoxin system